jgi:hypothetical protein
MGIELGRRYGCELLTEGKGMPPSQRINFWQGVQMSNGLKG